MGGYSSTYGGLAQSGTASDECARRVAKIEDLETRKNALTVDLDALSTACQNVVGEANFMIYDLKAIGCEGTTAEFDELASKIESALSAVTDSTCAGWQAEGPTEDECQRRRNVIESYREDFDAIGSRRTLTSACQSLLSASYDLLDEASGYTCSGSKANFSRFEGQLYANRTRLREADCQQDTTGNGSGPTGPNPEGLSQEECDRRADRIAEFRARLSDVSRSGLTNACRTVYGQAESALAVLDTMQCSGSASEFQAQDAQVADLVYRVELPGCSDVETSQTIVNGNGAAPQAAGIGTAALVVGGGVAVWLAYRALS